MNENMFEYQYATVLDTANNLIYDLKEQEAIFIINKNMEVRVLFYYKPSIYFISESFSIKNITKDSININDTNSIISICKYVSDKFEANDYLTESKLIKNIDKFIEEYMIDTLCLLVNRVKCQVLKSISLEYYNSVYLINNKGKYRLLNIDESIFKYDINLNKFSTITGNKNYYQQLFDYIFNKINIYPNDYTDIKSLKIFNTNEDIDNSSILILANISCNTLISYEKIIINNELDSNIIFDIVFGILNIDKNTKTLISDIKDITNYTNPKLLN